MRGAAASVLVVLGVLAGQGVAGPPADPLSGSKCLGTVSQLSRAKPPVRMLGGKGTYELVADGGLLEVSLAEYDSPVEPPGCHHGTCAPGAAPSIAVMVCPVGPVDVDGGTRLPFIVRGRGIALRLTFSPDAVSSAVPRGFIGLDDRDHADPHQTGCRQQLRVGTPLYGSPDGVVVGRVIGAGALFAPARTVTTSSGKWTMVRTDLGFGPLSVWLEDPFKDWCSISR